MSYSHFTRDDRVRLAVLLKTGISRIEIGVILKKNPTSIWREINKGNRNGKYLPSVSRRETRERKKKHFFVPIDAWLKDDLSSLIKELLSEKYVNKQKIFNYEYIKKLQDNFNNSKLYYSRQLWSLLTFQIWYKQFIENEKVKI